MKNTTSKNNNKLKLQADDKSITVVITAIDARARTLGKNLKPNNFKNYKSDGEDTFDKFDYEEEDKLEGYFIEENPALYFTNIEEIPTNYKEKKKKLKQQQQVVELLKQEKNIFTLNIENLERTDVITHTIHTANMLPIKQAPYRLAPDENDFLIDEVPEARGIAIEKVELAQRVANERHDQWL
ncbi:6967_t:CDS:2 [Cetraspora pellucida]|uniref:6967_t:CDS:1 n=1 Tax=Cetraspora pellucida TaxID=1433469 RepID=A0A9N8Z970_9GLOM|nr:6967_t:CDS:2 [Cetraspora pellucida]